VPPWRDREFGSRLRAAARGKCRSERSLRRAKARAAHKPRARDDRAERLSTVLLTISNSCHNHRSSWLATGRLPEDMPVGGAKERFPARDLSPRPGRPTVSPAGAGLRTGAGRPGSAKSRGTSAEGRCVSDRKEMRDASHASHNVPIARHVTVRSQAPCASRRSAPWFRGNENDAKPARAKVTRPAGTAKLAV